MSDVEIVIREVVNNVWTFSRPFSLFGLSVGGRSTAIKLKSGDVWVLTSTPLEPGTKAKIDELGPVKYIMAANMVHHMFIGDYKKAYPEAKLIAPEATIARHGDKDLVYDGVWGRDPPGTSYGYEDEIKACYFSGYKTKDVVFLHIGSKTLIQADLLFNLPANEQFSKTSISPKVPLLGSFSPSSWLHSIFIKSRGIDKTAMIRDAQTVASWDFERIIPCHGDVFETDGKKVWEAAYKSFL